MDFALAPSHAHARRGYSGHAIILRVGVRGLVPVGARDLPPGLTELFIPPCFGRNEKDCPGSSLGLG